MPEPGPAEDHRPRVTVVTNGNTFANLVLASLVTAPGLRLQVVVTTGMRRQQGSRLAEAVTLLRRWGLRYAAYKVLTYVVPLVAERVQHRPMFVWSTCRAAGVPVTVARNVNDPDLVAAVRAFAPDLLVSVSCPYRIGAELLAVPRVGALNVHSSLLPRYAGVGTYVHVLADGQAATGVTVHEMVEQFDAGRVVAQEEVPIRPADTVFALFSRQCRVASRLLCAAVAGSLREGRLDGVPQDASQRSYHREPDRATVRRARRRGHRLVTRRDLAGVFRTEVPREDLPALAR